MFFVKAEVDSSPVHDQMCLFINIHVENIIYLTESVFVPWNVFFFLLRTHFSSHFYFEVQLSRYPGSIRSTLPWWILRAPRSDSALLLLSGAVGNPSGSEVTAGEREEWRHLVAETETSAELKETVNRSGIRMTTNAFKMCIYSIFILIFKKMCRETD